MKSLQAIAPYCYDLFNNKIPHRTVFYASNQSASQPILKQLTKRTGYSPTISVAYTFFSKISCLECIWVPLLEKEYIF